MGADDGVAFVLWPVTESPKVLILTVDWYRQLRDGIQTQSLSGTWKGGSGISVGRGATRLRITTEEDFMSNDSVPGVRKRRRSRTREKDMRMGGGNHVPRRIRSFVNYRLGRWASTLCCSQGVVAVNVNRSKTENRNNICPNAARA